MAQADGSAGNAGLTAAASAPPPAWTGFRPLVVTAVRDESAADPVADAGRSRWAAVTELVSRTVDYAAAATRSRRCRRHPQLLAVQPARFGDLPDRSQEGTARARAADISTRGSRRVTCSTSPLPVALSRSPSPMTPTARRCCWCPRASGSPRCSRCCTRWSRRARRARCGGCTARATATADAFAAECHELLGKLPGGRSHVFYSRPAAADRLGLDYTGAGRISAEALDALGPPKDADAYLCGPVDFMTVLSAGARRLWAGAGARPQ